METRPIARAKRWRRAALAGAASALAVVCYTAGAQERIPYQRQHFVIETPRVVLAPRGGGPIANARALERAASAISSINQSLYLDSTIERLRQFDQMASLQDDRPRSQANAIEAIEISRPEARWLQLGFKLRDLGQSRLIISAPDVERTQVFTGEDLYVWNGHSVLFVSTTLRVQLVHEGPSELSLEDLINEVVVGESLEIVSGDGDEKSSDGAAPPHASCGRDDRVASQHPFVGRMMPEPCTAFLLEGGLAITAGHCMQYDRELQGVEFNVPAQAGVSAAVQDTYPIAPLGPGDCNSCLPGQFFGAGQDWAVIRLRDAGGRNAHAVQGGGFRIATPATIASAGNAQTSVVGFGTDRIPASADRTQQIAGGSTHGFDSTVRDLSWLNHLVDTADGNSGSPLFFAEADGGQSVLAIHVAGWCEPQQGQYNNATTFTATKLREALARLGAPAPP